VIPLDKLSALRLGRRLAVEVPASKPGRRAFVDVTPGEVEADPRARREGWTPSSTARTFTVEHWEYDAELIDGYDYDIGAALLRRASAGDESELPAVLKQWQVDPGQLQFSWNTAHPR
jgi:hypothetical protein